MIANIPFNYFNHNLNTRNWIAEGYVTLVTLARIKIRRSCRSNQPPPLCSNNFLNPHINNRSRIKWRLLYWGELSVGIISGQIDPPPLLSHKLFESTPGAGLRGGYSTGVTLAARDRVKVIHYV